MSRARNHDASRDPWAIEFFQRHRSDDPGRAVPGRSFLDGCPPGVRGHILAVLRAVAEAPPPRFAGGGYWEAMHGDMRGLHEVRATGPDRRHYRLFCLLDREGDGLARPTIVVITGLSKPFRTVFSARQYAKVRALAKEYSSRRPRSIAR